jgi:hypothetical protein
MTMRTIRLDVKVELTLLSRSIMADDRHFISDCNIAFSRCFEIAVIDPYLQSEIGHGSGYAAALCIIVIPVKVQTVAGAVCESGTTTPEHENDQSDQP